MSDAKGPLLIVLSQNEWSRAEFEPRLPFTHLPGCLSALFALSLPVWSAYLCHQRSQVMMMSRRKRLYCVVVEVAYLPDTEQYSVLSRYLTPTI